MPAFLRTTLSHLKNRGVSRTLPSRGFVPSPSGPDGPFPELVSIGEGPFFLRGPWSWSANCRSRSEIPDLAFSPSPSPARREKSGSSWYARLGERGSPFLLDITGACSQATGPSRSGRSHTTTGPLLPRRVACVPAAPFPFPEMIPKPPTGTVATADPAGRCATQAGGGSIDAAPGFALRGAYVQCHPGAGAACLGKGGLRHWEVQGEMYRLGGSFCRPVQASGPPPSLWRRAASRDLVGSSQSPAFVTASSSSSNLL